LSRLLDRDDLVVTPQGRYAVVEKRGEEGIECRYTANGEAVTLPEKLLRRVENGVVPPPVRIKR
jgi:hypothetical protein